MVDWWLSKPANTSSVIFISAVLVERRLRYADWIASNFDDVDTCGTNQINSSHSNILLIGEGRVLENVAGSLTSKPCFFRSGVNYAVLNFVGKMDKRKIRKPSYDVSECTTS